MDRELVGWPEDEPTLSLDHREFAYAGKFVMSSTGKAVAREDGRIVAAAAFDADRTDPSTLVIRYLTVRRDRRGAGIGPELVAFVVDRAADRGFDVVTIGVNNPFSYDALYKAGFEFTGEQSGLAELVLARPVGPPGDPDPDRYRAGLAALADRDLEDAERAFVERKRERGPPPVGDAGGPPDGGSDGGGTGSDGDPPGSEGN